MKKLSILLILLLALCLTGCGEEEVPAQDILVREAVYTFSDGTTVDLWEREHIIDRLYKLSDGTEILTVQDRPMPGNVFVGGMEGFSGLTEEAQERVTAYYEEVGSLLDMEQLLENAYADYLMCQEDEDLEFETHHAVEDLGPSMETERAIAYRTIIHVPADAHYERIVTECSSTTVFDRTTGEVIPFEELFLVPVEEVYDRFAEQCEVYYGGDVRDSIQPEWFVWYDDGLSFNVPAGLVGEVGCIFSVDYEDLEGVVQPWMVPETES